MAVLSNETSYFKPFLRWAGGKNWLLKHIGSHFPSSFKNYFEPFLGGGSIFFNLKTEHHACLSDINPDLIEAYIEVKTNVDGVLQALKSFKNTEKDYYNIRGSVYQDKAFRAAQFIYLNRTSFNGIYRVNRSGVYNVPYGHRHKIDHVQEEILIESSKRLQNTSLTCQDFEQALEKAGENDLVFIDPPYTVAHENNGFILYNQKLFSLEDQYRLAKCLKILNQKGAHFVVTNAYHDKIQEIYSSVGTMRQLQRSSIIGGKGANRGIIKEYIITNF